MKMLICGGRNFRDKEKLNSVLNAMERPELVISGSANGADTLGAQWALNHSIKVAFYPAAWSKYGKAAGAIRNQQMLDEGKPDLVVAFSGGKGTADMVARSKFAGIKVMEII